MKKSSTFLNLKVLVALVGLGSTLMAQPSYRDFHNSYTPHNKLQYPDNAAVVIIKEWDSSQLPTIFDPWCEKEDDRIAFVNVATSIDRYKIGKGIDLMKPDNAVLGFNAMTDYYALDVIYYVSEYTYNAIASRVKCLRGYNAGSSSGGSSYGGTSYGGSNVISYRDFHSKYSPHNKLQYPDNAAVVIIKEWDPSQLPTIFDPWCEKEDDRLAFVNVASSVDRYKIGKGIDLMKPDNAVLGLNAMTEYYALDVLYYVSEATYNAIAPRLTCLKNYGGSSSGSSSYGGSSYGGSSNIISYSDFHNRYKPHNTLQYPENAAVVIVKEWDPSQLPTIFDPWCAKDEDRIAFVNVATSIDRYKIGKGIDLMQPANAILGINAMTDYYALDIMYFVSESTWNNIASQIKVIQNYK